jgi:hypothetical protein
MSERHHRDYGEAKFNQRHVPWPTKAAGSFATDASV